MIAELLQHWEDGDLDSHQLPAKCLQMLSSAHAYLSPAGIDGVLV